MLTNRRALVMLTPFEKEFIMKILLSRLNLQVKFSYYLNEFRTKQTIEYYIRKNKNKEFLLGMHSFIYEKDQNKIISAQKILPKPTTSAMNPFYQFITNMKSQNIILPIETSINQRPSAVFISAQSYVSSQRKNSSELSDPRKILGLNKISQSQTNFDSKKPQISQALRTHEKREKRSRSRDKKISQNRQNSQSQSGKQKNNEFYRKTKLCPLYEKGECRKDSSHCNFAHGFQQLRCYKTQICYAFQRGQCKKPTEQCKYAHGKKQLRGIKDDHETLKNKYEDQEKTNLSQERQKKHHKNRDSESIHHHDRKDKKNGSRVDQTFKHSKKQKLQVVSDPLSYKKNLPLSKDYEKFLYGDSNPKVIGAQNSIYMIPNVSPNLPKNSYTMESYSIELGKNYEFYHRSSIPLGYSELERPYQDLLKQKDGLRQPPLPFYEKPSLEFHKKSNPYLNQAKNISDKKYYPENSYPEMSHHGYGKVDYVIPYHIPSSDFAQDLSKYPYKNTNQGGFNQQPFTNGVSKVDNFADSVYRRESSGYSQVSKPMGRPEDFYRNGPFNSGRQQRKNEFEGMMVGGNHNFSSYRKDFAGNGGYNGYPTMENNQSQVGKNMGGYSVRSYDQKGRYSNFPKKGYQ